ncbi:MMPL family transporter [Actinoallomurus purpureus]|uniref:MMPL family transporter n=1 Tax=Actinoallomurus purpureus TaxID=478114 RepID=UPI002092ABB9|nr:MMPL family transporter [Actinoallomurus purpureus]MCO6008025.1 MMPL family transporter [Actinoallomurus purpureus]
MAAFLYRLGRSAFRRRWYVAVMWVAVLGVVGFGAATAAAAPDDGFSMPGTESQKAFDLIQQRFPGAGKADGASARLVFVAPDGKKVTATGNRKVIESAVREVAAGPQVASAVSPFQAHAVSEDASTAYATVTYKVKSKDLTDADKKTLEDAGQRGRAAGLTVEVGGDVLASQPSAGGPGEIIGVAIAAIVLLITFGSLAAAGLPLITAMMGVGVGVTSIVALGSTLGLSMTTTTLASMLGLAVGIDYAMFIVSRYREERARGHAPEEAAGLAAGTAGSAVVFAGLTVVIALAGLSVVGVPMLTKMGLAAAGTVVVAVLVALTLVPALLGFFQRAVLPRAARRGAGSMDRVKANGGTRWARFVLRRPLPVLLLGVVGLGVLAVPVMDLQLGMAGDEAKSTSTTERRAYDDLAKGFGSGFNGPLTVVVDAKNATDPKAAVATITQKIGATHGVVSVSRARFNATGDTAVFSAVPATGPSDQKTKDIVHAIRAERSASESATGATFEVSGATAVNIDTAQKVQDALIPYLAVVVGLAFLLLSVVFRSVLVPLKAALGFLLSVLAALGSVVAIFQWGWLAGLLGIEPGPIMSLMPIFMVGIVFGLAMDYEVFLVARMREAYVHGDGPCQAVVSGFRNSARVVVAAALIMMAVFSGFIGSGESMIKMIGFGLATAVLLDAFVVRMAIVPAVLALLGERAWWMPHWLQKVLPRVDVEGEALGDRSSALLAANQAAGRESAHV